MLPLRARNVSPQFRPVSSHNLERLSIDGIALSLTFGCIFQVHSFRATFMRKWIKSLSLVPLLAFTAAAQVPTSVPNGLPSWAYNIPDKVQPPPADVTGPIHLPGSTK